MATVHQDCSIITQAEPNSAYYSCDYIFEYIELLSGYIFILQRPFSFTGCALRAFLIKLIFQNIGLNYGIVAAERGVLSEC